MEHATSTSRLTALTGGKDMRVLIMVDDDAFAELRVDQVANLDLHTGMDLDVGLLERIKEREASDKAFLYCVRILARRMYSAGELRDKMKKRDHPPQAIQMAIEDLTLKNYLNDEAYGRAVIRRINNYKPAGRPLLKQKLYRKKLDPKLIDQLLDESEATRDIVAEARAFASKRLAQTGMQRCEPQKRKQRIWSQLARRGFNYDVISEALKDLPSLTSTAGDDI